MAKKQTDISNAQKLGIGVGLTTAAVAAVGAYFLYGSKDAPKNRKKVKSWALKAKGEVLEVLEKAEKIEQAIILYEQSVKDLFAGTFPYDRLMVIYGKLKRYEDAVRVCETYIKNPYLHASNKKGLDEYEDKLKKLKAKIAV